MAPPNRQIRLGGLGAGPVTVCMDIRPIGPGTCVGAICEIACPVRKHPWGITGSANKRPIAILINDKGSLQMLWAENSAATLEIIQKTYPREIAQFNL